MTASAPRRRDSAREEGVVLVLAIVFIALTIGGVYAFARTTTLDVLGASQRMDRIRADLLARSGIAIGSRAIIEDLSSSDPLASSFESPRDTWRLLSQQTLQPIERDDLVSLRVEVIDSGRRIPLNALAGGGTAPGAAQPAADPTAPAGAAPAVASAGLPPDQARVFLQKALERIIQNMPGRPEEKRYDTSEIADAILDWIDADETTRLGDNEADFYRDRRAASLPPNRPLFSLSELVGIPGLDRRLLEAMDDYFSPPMGAPRFSGSGLNPNTAPPHVLALLYIVGSESFLEDEEIFRVLKAREDGQVFCPGQSSEEACVDFGAVVNLPGQALFPPISYESSVFMVRSRAKVGDASACVMSVLDRGDPEEIKPLAYRLDC